MNKITTLVYTGRVRTTGGRGGAARSDDGKLDVALSPPGSSGNGTNPEQLFAAGWSACFLSAIANAAQASNVVLPEPPVVDAEVDLGSNDSGYLLGARLSVSVPGVNRNTAQTLVDTAHQTCPYSKLSRGNIHVEIKLV